MAKITFRIDPTSKTLAQAAKGIRKDASKLFVGKALSQAPMIRKDIGDLLVKAFEETPVAKALRGQGSEDLPAHFGLSDGMANSLVDGMASLIAASVGVLAKSTGGNASITIRAVEDNWNEYTSLPGAQYVSSPSNVTIPVARWLLIDPSIDVGQAAYDIVFSGDDSKIDARIQKVSRSGRAIMVSLKSLGGSGGYVLPSIVSGQAGQNFIEYALGQSHVAMEAAKILMKRVQ